MKKYDDIRQKAKDLETQTLENYFAPLLRRAFKDLTLWIPDRRITLIWGMGTYVLSVQSKNSQSFFNDMYDNVEDLNTLKNNTKPSFQDTPLYKLVELLEECHDINGIYLCFADWTYQPLN